MIDDDEATASVDGHIIVGVEHAGVLDGRSSPLLPAASPNDAGPPGVSPPSVDSGAGGPPFALSDSAEQEGGGGGEREEVVVDSPPIHGVRWDIPFTPQHPNGVHDIDGDDAPLSVTTAATAASAQQTHPPLSHSSATGSLQSPMMDDEGETSAAAAAASSSQHHLTARERLVERERQSRLERQRAQVKRRIALNREAEEMELARAGIDLDDLEGENGNIGETAAMHVGDGGDANHHQGMATTLDELAGRNGSIVGTVGDASVHGADGDVEHHHDHSFDADDTGGGGAGVGGPPLPQEGEALGYAMERFLSEQVLVTDRQDSADIDNGADGGNSVLLNSVGEPTVPVNSTGDADIGIGMALVEVDHDAPSQDQLPQLDDESGPARSGSSDRSRQSLPRPDLDIHDVPDTVGLSFPPTSTTSYPPDSTVSFPPNSTASFPPNSTASVRSVDTPGGASLDEQIMASPLPVRTGSYDLSTSNRSDETDDARGSTTATTDFAPRLARLTEAEILEMNDLDDASVGNVPPRSVRDEDDESLLRMGSYVDPIGTSIAGTQTTAVETVSTGSARSTTGRRTSTASIHGEADDEQSALLVMSPVIGSDGGSRSSRSSLRVGLEDTGATDIGAPDIGLGQLSSPLINERSSSPHVGFRLEGSAILHPRSASLLTNPDDLESSGPIDDEQGAFDNNGYPHHDEDNRASMLETVDTTSPAAATIGEFIEDGTSPEHHLQGPLLQQGDYHDYGATNGDEAHGAPRPAYNGNLNGYSQLANGDHHIPSDVRLGQTDSAVRETNERTLHGMLSLKAEIPVVWLVVTFGFGLALGLFLSR